MVNRTPKLYSSDFSPRHIRLRAFRFWLLTVLEFRFIVFWRVRLYRTFRVQGAAAGEVVKA